MPFVALFDFRAFPLFLSQADFFPEIQNCSKAANVFSTAGALVVVTV